MSHVTVHLWQVPGRMVPAALLRMTVDRLWLRGTPGLVFHRLLGTGDGRTFRPHDADLRTWGLVCTWTDRPAADAFEAHPTPRGWRRIARREWRADLACLRSRGLWGGSAPFTPSPAVEGWTGPVASITRARLSTRRTVSFWRAVPPVVDDLAEGTGPLLRVGIGEAPVGLQGTFTVWPDAAALADFAYRRAPHRQVIAETARQGWYVEELFARFALLAHRGDPPGPPLPLGVG